ncbi:Ni/Fe hydrogenase subunit alpha [Candidatus Bathyarchaeota archaeon]|nr:MAG: Ni/Fe hydrogenase subunit alpha [Candidatus Bathyarchaeota archaeon]
MIKSKILKFGYLPRVEGHMSYTVNFKTGDVHVEVLEGVRLFEGFIRGRKFDEVIYFVSRICGICPCSHNLCSIKAVEDAFQIQPSEQTIKLRKLINFGEIIQSHVGHLYFLALPDFLGFKDIFSALKKYPEEVKIALRLREVANSLIDVVGGRAVHPVSTTINGFRKLPSETQLKVLLDKLKNVRDDAAKTVELFAKLSIPDFERNTEYAALKNEAEYGLYDGYVASSEGLKVEARNYKDTVVEVVKPYSTAKFSFRNGKPFCVGALARLNINKDQLNDEAKKVMDNVGVKFPSYNPYHYNIAQAVEVVHCVEESIKIIEDLLSIGLRDEQADVKVKAGVGASVVEAPRGILYHKYSIDEDGFIREADILTPTAQNVANIEEDIRVMLPTLLNLPRKQATARIESLIRAYDPCISCSVHLFED